MKEYLKQDFFYKNMKNNKNKNILEKFAKLLEK